MMMKAVVRNTSQHSVSTIDQLREDLLKIVQIVFLPYSKSNCNRKKKKNSNDISPLFRRRKITPEKKKCCHDE